jgi:hypothetical protein
MRDFGFDEIQGLYDELMGLRTRDGHNGSDASTNGDQDALE